MTRDVEHIILNKAFAELTPVEHSLIQEWAANEEEFNMHKAILQEAPSMDEEILPPPSLKASLKADFTKHHAEGTPLDGRPRSDKKKVVSMYVRVAWSVAAVLILGLLVYPLLKEDTVLEANKQTPMAQKEEVSADLTKKKETDQPLAVLDDVDQAQVNNQKSQRKNKLDNANSFDVAKREEEVQTLKSEDLSESLNGNGAAWQNESANNNQMRLSATPNYSISPATDLSTNTFSQTTETAVAADAFVHADILTEKDVLKTNRQIVADQPQILNLLYTSF